MNRPRRLSFDLASILYISASVSEPAWHCYCYLPIVATPHPVA